MRQDDVDKFFDLWPPLLLEKGRECPPDSVLAIAAQGKMPPEWTGHLENCRDCQAVIELLQATGDPGSRLQRFIDKVKADAERAAPRRQSVIAEFLREFPSMRLARQVGISAAALAIILAITWQFVNKDRLLGNKSSLATAPLEVDKYGKAVQLLQAAFEEPGFGSFNDQRTHARQREIKELLDGLDREQLNPEAAAKLDNLVVAYNEWMSRQFPSQSGAQFARTRHSDQLAEFYATLGLSSRYPVESSPIAASKTLSPRVRTEAIRSGTEEFRVIRIEEVKTEEGPAARFVVQDLVSHRDLGKARALELDVQAFADRHNTSVYFADTKKDFVPARPSPRP